MAIFNVACSRAMASEVTFVGIIELIWSDKKTE
jgi:hypothetical protein